MRRIAFLLCALVGSAALSAAAPEKDKGKSKGKDHQDQTPAAADRAGAHGAATFADRDREIVRVYWTETYGPNGCPPGLAKKHNGCLPPGQAKKRYAVGQPLGGSIVVQPLPPVLVTRLGPPPAGYDYAVVDGDVVKLVIGTRMVVDAITALVH